MICKCGGQALDDGTCSRCLSHMSGCRCPSLSGAARRPRRRTGVRRNGPVATPTTAWDRLPIEKRMGTRVDPAYAQPIIGLAKHGRMRHGTILRNERVYQGGGELGNFMLHKRQLITIAMDVWTQLQRGVDVIEMIDHRANRCFRITFASARDHGYAYDEGIGMRWGIPVEYWMVEQGERPPLIGARLDAPAPPVSRRLL